MIDDITHWLAAIPDNVLTGVLGIILLVLVFVVLPWHGSRS